PALRRSGPRAARLKASGQVGRAVVDVSSWIAPAEARWPIQHLSPAQRQMRSCRGRSPKGCRMTDKNAEPLLPVELGSGKIKFAQGMKAGRWVFATGIMAQDFVNGIAPDVLAERMPHAGRPKREKEAQR